jgi:bifunctional DNase/RNase
MGEKLEMVIDSIRVSLMTYQRVVILKEKETNRYLPIWIGPAEADAIAVKLQNVSVPRPLTHDLLRTVIHSLGSAINHIIVSDLENDTFFAKVVLMYNENTIEVDARPSDAIALAVREQIPIFADETVLTKAGILLDKETGKPLITDMAGGKKRTVSEEELKSLSAFKDFIDQLDMDDLGIDDPGKS